MKVVTEQTDPFGSNFEGQRPKEQLQRQFEPSKQDLEEENSERPMKQKKKAGDEMGAPAANVRSVVATTVVIRT